ncbi:KpsF/GutQ family sugar-phosphate isomerase [Asticcacaulis sp. SL142]|uniref:KpsF/GutQ family sugar-phosphate isomerase n=1 Tax=Asticcacaulis sp. SL142 TaxID=2995155 RepID=UPI00226CE9DE|nr:KpsF/GutQ family sugar-phosphate isomerase [Asticcacaulis sp. SL142]WAC47087.1 KpsF/GutQ family sugar-phosphate isomerase [Asticcacaulis sp. SL142]
MSDSLSAARNVLKIEAEALMQMATALERGPLADNFERAIDTLFDHKGRVILTGVGKSGHVGKKIAATFASTGTSAFFVHATEASHGDLGMVGPDDVIMALSKSGETKELADVIAYSKRFGITLIGITARADSALGKAADIPLIFPNAPEAFDGVDAPTTSTTLQIALGDCLAVALMKKRGFTAQDFGTYHPGGKLGAALKSVSDLMHGTEVPLVAQSAPMPTALITMTEKRFGAVGVVDGDGHLIGVVTDGDLRRHMDGLMDKTAIEVMTAKPLTVSPTMLAAEALKIMNEKRITVLFVTDNNIPVGILHVHDVLRAGVV